jgi:hypothetical protein
MKLIIEPEASLETLVGKYREGAMLWFVMLEEVREATQREVLAIINDADYKDTAGHSKMLELYHERFFGEFVERELKCTLDPLFVGGGFIGRSYVTWKSNSCARMFGRDKPSDKVTEKRLLVNIKVKFNEWLAKWTFDNAVARDSAVAKSANSAE